MKHATVNNLNNGYVQLVPSNGYRLYSRAANAYFAEAVVKEKKLVDFEAVKLPQTK